MVGIVFLSGGSSNDKIAGAIIIGRSLYYCSSIVVEDVLERKVSPKEFNGTWILGETRNIVNKYDST
jgi:hypothetical protein